MANDTRGNRQFNWLRQVAYRRDLLRQCSGVAIALTKYFNSEEDEWARPAVQRIADDLGISLNAAHDALKALDVHIGGSAPLPRTEVLVTPFRNAYVDCIEFRPNGSALHLRIGCASPTSLIQNIDRVHRT